MTRTSLLVTTTALCLGLGLTGFAWLKTPQTAQAPTSIASTQPAERTTGVGEVAGTVRGTVRTDHLKLSPEAIQTQMAHQFAHAPEEVRTVARALMAGEQLPALPDADAIISTYPSSTPSLDEPSSLLRTALSFDRMDAIHAFLDAGVDANVDQHIILWKVLEQWTPGTAADHTGVLVKYIANGGLVDIAHDEGFSAIELAATVSSDVVLLLIANGASPWIHPDGYGAGLMERLSLHVDVPYVLDMIGIIANSPHIAPADTRALENTIGNLVDHFDILADGGASLGVEQGKPTGEPLNPKIETIANIVMTLAKLENTPWGYIPQEFIDMKEADLLE